MNDYLYLAHHGILGQKWGVRRYQNEDGSLTSAGLKRYSIGSTVKKDGYKERKFSLYSTNVFADPTRGKAAKPGMVKTHKIDNNYAHSRVKNKEGKLGPRVEARAGRYKTFGNKDSSVYSTKIFDKTGDKVERYTYLDEKSAFLNDDMFDGYYPTVVVDYETSGSTIDSRNAIERLFNTLNTNTLREANRTYIDSAQAKGEKRDSYAGAYKTDLEIDKLRELDKLNETDSATLLTQIHEAVLSKKIESNIEFAYEFGTNYDTETVFGKGILNILTMADRVVDTVLGAAVPIVTKDRYEYDTNNNKIKVNEDKKSGLYNNNREKEKSKSENALKDLITSNTIIKREKEKSKSENALKDLRK